MRHRGRGEGEHRAERERWVVELVCKTEICTQTWVKEGGRRKRAEGEGEQEEGEREGKRGMQRWWSPEIGFTGQIFIPALSLGRRDSGHWTVLKLARGPTQDSRSAATASLQSYLMQQGSWFITEGLGGSVFACKCVWVSVCVQVFMGPCSCSELWERPFLQS